MKNPVQSHIHGKANTAWQDFMESLDPAKYPDEVSSYQEYREELKTEGHTLDESAGEVSETQQILNKIAQEPEDEDSEAHHLFLKIAREEMQRYKTIRNLVEAEGQADLSSEEKTWLLGLIKRRINDSLDLIDLELA